MKIKNDELELIIPNKNTLNIIVEKEYKETIIEAFTSYFAQKKKSKYVILDDDGDLIPMDEVSFIYIPSNTEIEQWFDFKSKTLLNTELSKTITTNPDYYLSIEKLRQSYKDLLTDKGMYRFLEILSENTNLSLKMEVNDFDITKLLPVISIKHDELSKKQMFMILYNLLMFINRDKYCVVYIDFNVDNESIEWISEANKNNLILISNDSLQSKTLNSFDSMIVIANSSNIEVCEEETTNIGRLSYLFHSIIQDNLDYQTEKNLNLIRQYSQINQSFLINFTASTTL